MAEHISVPVPEDYNSDPAKLAKVIAEIADSAPGDSPLDKIEIEFYRGEANLIIAALTK